MPGGISARGVWRHQVGHVIDVVPTCLEVAHATYPAELEGHRLTPLEGKSLVPAFTDRPVASELSRIVSVRLSELVISVDRCRFVAAGQVAG